LQESCDDPWPGDLRRWCGEKKFWMVKMLIYEVFVKMAWRERGVFVVKRMVNVVPGMVVFLISKTRRT